KLLRQLPTPACMHWLGRLPSARSAPTSSSGSTSSTCGTSIAWPLGGLRPASVATLLHSPTCHCRIPCRKLADLPAYSANGPCHVARMICQGILGGLSAVTPHGRYPYW